MENILYIMLPVIILIIGLHVRIEHRITQIETDVKWLILKVCGSKGVEK